MSSSVIKILDNDWGVVKCCSVLTIKVGTFCERVQGVRAWISPRVYNHGVNLGGQI